MRGVVVALSILIVFIASFTLFYIFDSLNKIAERCEAGEELEVCKLLSGFSFAMLIILLVIGGFVLIICATGYLMISSAK